MPFVLALLQIRNTEVDLFVPLQKVKITEPRNLNIKEYFIFFYLVPTKWINITFQDFMISVENECCQIKMKNVAKRNIFSWPVFRRLSLFDKRLHDLEIIWTVEKQFVVTHCNNVLQQFICINNDGFLVPSEWLIQAIMLEMLWINHNLLTVRGSTFGKCQSCDCKMPWKVVLLLLFSVSNPVISCMFSSCPHQLSRCYFHQW